MFGTMANLAMLLKPELRRTLEKDISEYLGIPFNYSYYVFMSYVRKHNINIVPQKLTVWLKQWILKNVRPENLELSQIINPENVKYT